MSKTYYAHTEYHKELEDAQIKFQAENLDDACTKAEKAFNCGDYPFDHRCLHVWGDKEGSGNTVPNMCDKPKVCRIQRGILSSEKLRYKYVSYLINHRNGSVTKPFIHKTLAGNYLQDKQKIERQCYEQFGSYYYYAAPIRECLTGEGEYRKVHTGMTLITIQLLAKSKIPERPSREDLILDSSTITSISRK